MGVITMMNGTFIKMNKGRFTRTFYLFADGEAVGYTEEGIRNLTCEFTTLYSLLVINGWKEINA